MFIAKLNPQTSSWAEEPETSLYAKMLLKLMMDESANERINPYGSDGLHGMKPVMVEEMLSHSFNVTVADEPLFTRTTIELESNQTTLHLFEEEVDPLKNQMNRLMQLLGQPNLPNNRKDVVKILNSVSTSTTLVITMPKYIGFYSNKESLFFHQSKDVTMVTTIAADKGDFNKTIQLSKGLNIFKTQGLTWVK